ncbi:TPA: DNA-binding domain-containing protein [Enterococcus faecalis]|uniref:DNA-binding domain-containing protein n=1 Tax=Enterococcus faecalis TaxID=1351 RepID=UPI001EE47EA9|nr:DNA-binding domain-containing protein [Enterococcus faecalis]EHB5082241.1 response regulator [Enterococcus faecalis]EKK5285608.1 DNA-binding domain-containing protein [Enterococcus faecalis]MDK7899401.1 DNA-binding domain-containing protein [Enterococcus faecalis]UKU96277.1 response regulator [Enterococcus faecalis]UKU98972.1 response regulator [Enterococcus faecalis]
MNFYIIDDDPSVVMILQRIIEEDFNHVVCKSTNDSIEAYKDLLISDINIVLIDLLMPKLDGVTLVEKIHKSRPKLKFIMISQVRDETLRQNAYKSGIEFFINKPINIVEVRSVVSKVKQSIEMEAKLKNIQELLGSSITQQTQENIQERQIERIRSILSFLGITAEGGYSDIIAICKVMLDYNLSFEQVDFNKYLSMDAHCQKIMLQRVRRAVKKAMVNIAHLCIDDFENEIVFQYANNLFGYQNIHLEIQAIQKENLHGGKITLRKFFDELIAQSYNTLFT